MRRPTVILPLLLLLAACSPSGSDATPDVDAGASVEAGTSVEADLDAGRAALAACEEVGGDADPVRDHEDPDSAPPADAMYEAHAERPAHSGSHFGVWELPSVVTSEELADLDERALVHNLEHGAVVVAIAADHPDAPDGADVAGWANTLVQGGFDSGRAGGGVYAVTYPTMPTGMPVALRAWGVALDCPSWSADLGSAFVVAHYGERGQAPEKELSPYPDNVIEEPGPAVR